MSLSANKRISNHLGLIAYGGKPRQSRMNLWSDQDLLPLIVNQGNAGEGARYFDGLIFEAGCDTQGGIVSPRYLGMSGPATMNGWREAADALFAEGCNVAAAMDVSRRLGPRETFDCWLALPYPPENERLVFGTQQSRDTTLERNLDARLRALDWWMKTVQTEWLRTSARYPGHCCRLRGFVWMKSAIVGEDRTLTARISRLLSERQMQLMWCANYGSTGTHDGSSLGFHQVCIRPTFLGYGTRGKEWIKQASIFASKYKLGMVVWEAAQTRSQVETWLSMLRRHYEGGVHIYEIGASRIASWHRHHHPFYEQMYQYFQTARESLRNRSDRDEGLA